MSALDFKPYGREAFAVYPCACFELTHFIAFSAYDDVDAEMYVTDFLAAESLLDKLRGIWAIIKGGRHITAEIALTTDMARCMGNDLLAWANKQPTYTLSVSVGGTSGSTWVYDGKSGTLTM